MVTSQFQAPPFARYCMPTAFDMSIIDSARAGTYTASTEIGSYVIAEPVNVQKLPFVPDCYCAISAVHGTSL